MSVAWFGSKTGPSESPTKGTSDGPSAAYPHLRLPGRGDHGPVLPRRRHLHAAQPGVAKSRVAQAALGLRGPDVGAFPAASGRRERAVLPARCPEVLLAPVPRDRRAASLLVASAGEEAQAFSGTLAPHSAARVGRRAREPHHRLDALGSTAPASGFAVGGFRGSCVGEVGIVRRIRGEAAPHLLAQPRAHLLRADRGQRRGRALGGGAFGRSWSR